MPHALTGLRVETDDAVGEQIHTGTLAAIDIAAGRLDRYINVAELFVACQRSPCTGVAGERVGILAPVVFTPSFRAEFARLRNRVERPQQLAGANVIAADVARGVEPGR